jgi:hypothetical protein
MKSMLVVGQNSVGLSNRTKMLRPHPVSLPDSKDLGMAMRVIVRSNFENRRATRDISRRLPLCLVSIEPCSDARVACSRRSAEIISA